MSQEAFLRASTRGANNVGITSVLVETGGGSVDLGRLPETDMPAYRLRSLAL